MKKAEQLGIDSEVIEDALNLHLDVHACLIAAIVYSIDTDGDGHVDGTEVRQTVMLLLPLYYRILNVSSIKLHEPSV